MLATRKIKIFLLALLTAMAAIGFVVFISIVINESRKDLKAGLQTLADESAVEQDYLSLGKVLEQTEEERHVLNSYILSGQDDTVRFLSDIDTVAEKLNVELVTNKLEVGAGEKEDFDILRASFTLIGSENATMQMLALFETLPYHGYISQFTTSRTVDVATGVVKAKSTIDVVLSIISD